MVARPGPIIAGPWLGEVGFELLYWVPFLAWFAGRFGVPAERLLVLSRGGAGCWYQSFATRHADVFEQVTPEWFRAQHDARVRELGEQKQTRVTEFDRELVATAAARSRIGDWSLLHPSRMYELLNPYWWGHLPGAWVQRHARYRRLNGPALVDMPTLPPSYTAVKFYFNECFPSSARNRAFAQEALRALAARGPVVALSTGLNIDDHGGLRVDASGVMHLPEGMDPARNLEIQTAVVAGASAFVGTYGGFSYLAPFHGVLSYAYYSDADGFARTHLHVAREAFNAIGTGDMLHVQDIAAGPGALGLEP